MNRVLRYKRKEKIGSKENLITHLINQIHASNLERHSGITAGFHRFKAIYYRPFIFKNIKWCKIIIFVKDVRMST